MASSKLNLGFCSCGSGLRNHSAVFQTAARENTSDTDGNSSNVSNNGLVFCLHTFPCYGPDFVLPVSFTPPSGAGVVINPSPLENPLSFPDYFNVNEKTSIRELLESRVHLGHKTGMWNPLMKHYLHGSRDGIHIIDLDKTLEHLQLALNVTGHIAYRSGIILFINERSQFERLIQQTARDCGEYFVTQKWRGGTLTNSYMLLGTLRLPDLAIFLSVPPSKTAIKEVAMCNIPSVGIVDSDCNPSLITYPIPGNDDTPSAMRLYCRLFCDVIKQAKAKRKEVEETASKKDL